MKSNFFLFLLLVFLCACSQVRESTFTHPPSKPRISVEQRLQQYGEASRAHWAPFFRAAKVSYPPRSFTLLGLKNEGQLEVYAPDRLNRLKFIRTFPVCAASGGIGPKLQEGDRQVPEGIYQIVSLNPNSKYHLSLRLSYPNLLDQYIAVSEGRTRLGGDIMIHGKCSSRGCLAMEDQAAEDLFVLAADAGIHNAKVILSPFDFRHWKLHPDDIANIPEWTLQLYSLLALELNDLPVPPAIQSR